jgi:hypothetical protein
MNIHACRRPREHARARTHPHTCMQVPANGRHFPGTCKRVPRLRALARVQGRRRQLHSARRQTTSLRARGQRLKVIVQGRLRRIGRTIPGLQDTGSSETVLQGSSCVSATHSHTRTWLSWVYASKLVCDALAVAGVNRRPFGLLPALLQEACKRARHTS